MKYTIREELFDDKVCHHMDVGLLQRVIPPQLVEQVLSDCGAWEERERKLNMVAMVYLLIVQALEPELAREDVFAQLVAGLRLLGVDLPPPLAGKSALAQRLLQLGEESLQQLFARCARPLATMQTTPQAFWKGLRLMALDGTLDSVPDTESTRQSFRYSSDHPVSRSPFPLLRMLLLVECGTHLICDAAFSSCREGEVRTAESLIKRSLQADMLVLWDSGLHKSVLFFLVRQLQGQVLGRLKDGILTAEVERLPDGSYLTYVYEDQDHHQGEHLLVRVISYTFTDERIPSVGQTHRLVTTLLDHEQYPALELAALYHERWHVEEVIDELKTHLRLSARTLRALTPAGIRQEVYGVLLAHIAVRRLMLEAAALARLAPTQLSFSKAVRLWEQTQPYSLLVAPQARARWEEDVLHELAQARLPVQRLRLQARVVKRVRSKYERKQPLHLKAPPFEPGVDFQHLMALVT